MYTKFVPLVLGVICCTCPSTVGAGDAPGLFDTSWLGFDTAIYPDDGAWYPSCLAIADFDGDGDLDAAAATENNFLPVAPRVSVVLNHGDGTFGSFDSYTTPTESEDILAVDVDSDGDVDLVVSNTGTHGNGTSVSLLRNNGDGTFASSEEYSVGAAGPVGLATADFDADGDPDLAVANPGWLGQGTTVSLLRNNGDGTFAPPVTYPAGDSPYKIDVGDFDADGFFDLAVANGGTGLDQSTVTHILRNDGSGGFEAPLQLPSLITGGSFYPSVRCADIDLDGDTDVLYADLKLHVGDFNSSYGVALYLNTGTGAFAPPTVVPLGLYTGSFSDLAVGDVTGDGWPDIIGCHDANQGWSVIPSDGNGGYSTYREYVAAEYPTDLAAGDVDVDGDLDVLVLALFSLELTVHFNPGNGDFSMPPSYPVVGGSYHFDAADIDSDGDLDIAASRGYATSGHIALLENLGDGTFGPYTSFETPVYAQSVKLRDLNGDAVPDLMWADKYPPYSFCTRLNNGDGTFGAIQHWTQTFTCGISLNNDGLEAVDLDNDGDLDVILNENLGCGTDPQQIFVHENDGAGNLTLVGIIDMPDPPYGIVAGDLDGDGNVDLITGGFSVTVLMGRGDLTFDPPFRQGSVDAPATSVVLSELNGDGLLDLALGVPEYVDTIPSLGVMLGNGDGTFLPPTLFPGTFSPNLAQITALTPGDPDADGDTDIIVGNYAANDLSFFENTGDGTFLAQTHFGAGNKTRDVLYADFDGDGVGDVAAMVSDPEGLNVIAIVAGRGGCVNPFIRGDANGDGIVDIADAIFDLQFLFVGGPEPDPVASGDGNGDGTIDVSDAVYLLGYLLGGGPPPPAPFPAAGCE